MVHSSFGSSIAQCPDVYDKGVASIMLHVRCVTHSAHSLDKYLLLLLTNSIDSSHHGDAAIKLRTLKIHESPPKKEQEK
jgi:hypothetical protein